MPRHSRPIPTHNAQESSDRAACAAGADCVFVPDNGVITFNLNRLPGQKKTEALQYQRALFRTWWLKKAVIRVSCFVFRENLTGRGSGGSGVSPRRVPGGGGWGCRSRKRRHHFQPKPALGQKKTEGLQYQKAVTPRARRTYQGCHENSRRESCGPERRLRRCRPGAAAGARPRKLRRRYRRADRGRLPGDRQAPQPSPVGAWVLGAGHLLDIEERQHFQPCGDFPPPLVLVRNPIQSMSMFCGPRDSHYDDCPWGEYCARTPDRDGPHFVIVTFSFDQRRPPAAEPKRTQRRMPRPRRDQEIPLRVGLWSKFHAEPTAAIGDAAEEEGTYTLRHEAAHYPRAHVGYSGRLYYNLVVRGAPAPGLIRKLHRADNFGWSDDETGQSSDLLTIDEGLRERIGLFMKHCGIDPAPAP